MWPPRRDLGSRWVASCEEGESSSRGEGGPSSRPETERRRLRARACLGLRDWEGGHSGGAKNRCCWVAGSIEWGGGVGGVGVREGVEGVEEEG